MYDYDDTTKGGENQVAKQTFRAKKYQNAKEEKKFQVSGEQSDFAKFLKGDAKAVEEFTKAVTEGLKA